MNSRVVLHDLVGHLLCEIEKEKFVDQDSACAGQRYKNVWQSFLFCILSSQVSSKVATRIVARIDESISFFDARLTMRKLEEQLCRELGESSFRHRFPRSKARQVSHSWFAFMQIHEEFDQYLNSFADEKIARRQMIRTFAGLGMKQASMLLRDVGYSRNLAIIDTHILWYCKVMFGFSAKTLTPKKYLQIEDLMSKHAENFQTDLGSLDTAVWVAVKSFKESACMMQSA
jgi:N-glycosylase/DNA lyase